MIKNTVEFNLPARMKIQYSDQEPTDSSVSLSKCKRLILFISNFRCSQAREMHSFSKADYGILFGALVSSRLRSQSRFAALSSYELLLEDLSLQSMKYCPVKESV